MRSERQALADIAKLCDEAEYDPNHPGFVVSPWDVRAILADVQPEPAPAGGTIDRDALMRALVEFPWLGRADDVYRIANVILALVRPVEGGIVLTHEEATLALDRLHAGVNWSEALGLGSWSDADRALAERLEAAS